MNQFEKQERFKNKAYKRVEKIENSLAVLSCFANRELYDYSASEVMTLFNRIETAIIDTRKKYIEELSGSGRKDVNVRINHSVGRKQ